MVAMTLVMRRRPLSFGVSRSQMFLQMLGPNEIILSLALNRFVDINVILQVCFFINVNYGLHYIWSLVWCLVKPKV